MTYGISFYGTHEDVEQAIRIMDKIVRDHYNVFGGRREYSGKDRDGNYEVVMTYTADWSDLNGLFPEYSFKSLCRTFYRKSAHLMDCWTSREVEIPDVEAWRRGER